ncbi:hypothetical protein JYT28_00035 [Desulfobulbus sp. AH-315-M07]|nr:hypothetical protein [Desulfobulbus sp. AH-315-M07]
MLDLRRWGSALVVLGMAALLGPACAAGGNPQFGTGSDEDDGDVGGAGGVEEVPPPLPCGIDCSVIVSPECFRSECDTATEQCVIVTDDGAECDDGAFCTVDDSCLDGVCSPGLPNDCGMMATSCHEIACDETTQLCAEQLLPDGTVCEAADLCTVNSKCQMGMCVGNPKDCMFSPKPDPVECHTAMCNPTTGNCEPSPANDGVTCVDVNDLCSVGNTCTAGTCVGGTPTDCSALTVGCVNGVCNAMNGDCEEVLILQGGACAEGDDQCTEGICDAMGNCDPTPFNDGGMCTDFNSCTTGELCSTGICTGGAAVTACMDGDNCCPAACDEFNDLDCACGVGDLRILELNIGDQDYIALTNPSACDLSLNGLQLFFDDSALADLTTVLPNQLLGAGLSVYVKEANVAVGDIDSGGNITFSYTRGGAVVLCNGVCDPADGTNVIDVVAFSLGDPHPTLPTGVTFQAAGLTGIDNTNDNTESFLRSNYVGQPPDLLATDWVVGMATL